MKKLQIIQMYTEHKSFNYVQPEMTYDKKTGEVTIHDQKKEKPKKIIKSMDEALKMK
jgi:hypothetical protein